MKNKSFGSWSMVAVVAFLVASGSVDAAQPPIVAKCFKPRVSECVSNLTTYYTNLGCSVNGVACTGNPPPPGVVKGDYTCSVSSGSCSPTNSQGACSSGTSRVGSLGMHACKSQPIAVKCARPSRTDCQSNLQTYFGNVGCAVDAVTCTGNPPPPGGTTGNYDCRVASSTCAPANAQGACPSGTVRVGELGVYACKAAPIAASCSKPSRSECTSNVRGYFTNLGCAVEQVTCAGNPPPPGAAVGSYQCSVESSTCTPLIGQGCPEGTTRVGALGMFACRPGG